MRTHRVVEVSNVLPVDDSSNEVGLLEIIEQQRTSRKRRRTKFPVVRQEHGPEFKVYCPCLNCDLRSKPTLRLLRICTSHIALHVFGVKWKVKFQNLYLIMFNLAGPFGRLSGNMFCSINFNCALR